MIERAIVLAAGFGKRVLPLTNTTPKPLLKINNVSLLENTLNFLKKFGVKSFAVNTHHLGEQIVAFVEKNKNIYDIKIFKEQEILGTGGGIRNALDFFQAEDGIRDFCLSRGLGDVYKRQENEYANWNCANWFHQNDAN